MNYSAIKRHIDALNYHLKPHGYLIWIDTDLILPSVYCLCHWSHELNAIVSQWDPKNTIPDIPTAEDQDLNFFIESKNSTYSLIKFLSEIKAKNNKLFHRKQRDLK